VFCDLKEKRSGGQTAGATFENLIILANLGPQEFAIALDAHFSTGQEFSYGRDCLFRVLRAGTDGENEVTKGKFRTGLQDQAVFLHCFVSF
jgi:hypothetical protein